MVVRATFPVIGAMEFDERSREEVDFIVREIVLEGAYLRDPIRLEPGAVVIDAGANIGVFSRLVREKLAGDCALYAFEPIPSTFRRLEENLGADAHLFPVALGSGAGRVTFTLYPALPGNATSKPEEKRAELLSLRERMLASTISILRPMVEERFEALLENEEVECEVRPLSEVVDELGIERIDLLKVDVEGAELEVLDGIDDGTWERIHQVALETGTGEAAVAAADQLRARGFRVVAEIPSWAAAAGLPNHEVRGAR